VAAFERARQLATSATNALRLLDRRKQASAGGRVGPLVDSMEVPSSMVSVTFSPWAPQA
jgi:hypothetical protein